MNEPGNISNKKLTLANFNLSKDKCNDRLKSSLSAGNLHSVKGGTAVEVKRKRKNNLLSFVLQGEDTDASLTKQEQVSRINAFYNAALIKQEVESHHKQEDEYIEIEKDTVEENQNFEDVKCIDDNKKNIKETNRNDQKFKKAKPNINKNQFSNTYSKHEKFALEKALVQDQNDESRQAFGIRAKRNKRSKPIKRSNISREILIPDEITVRELAKRMAERSKDVLNTLSKIGKTIKLDDFLDPDTACEIAVSFNHTFKRVGGFQVEEKIFQIDEKLPKLPRPPIVTFMGHVDHGKTSLLDLFRKSNVAEKESGGITQKIGAYQTTTQGGHRITFIDTPGHEAFTAMRACGTNITDIVVLVIAADDGIMDQTIEAISHAKAANVSIIVAVNKIDKVSNVGDSVIKIANNLLQYDLISEELGGDVIIVPVSAKQKINLEELEETIIMIGELINLRAATDCRASGVVIESKVDKSHGILATLVVQQGTLKIGDIIIIGNGYGKIRSMFDHNGRNEKVALPSTPIEVAGLGIIPNSGDQFVVVESEKQAREVVEYRNNLSNGKISTNLIDIFSQENDVTKIPIILKCDVTGSIEAIRNAIVKLSNEEVKVNVLHSGIGVITESDILLAEASHAIILAFNVKADSRTRNLIKQKQVDIRFYDIIYELINDIKDLLNSKLKPIIQEHHVGLASVREVFNIDKTVSIIGCHVTSGIIKKGTLVRLKRNDRLICEGEVKTLRRFKDDVKEVKSGFECGISLSGCTEVQPNDIIEAFELITKQAKLN
ncbi:translation initiation factor IF-2 [Candidatus Mesenet endosymbiont of Agriotes lineatus]|uniref:translation initiation factor IF-2 n=1 Tax=Candidatus Mesenet endosymbiont of Agriotes lineatus TaxID=3077948 RepID=UPI0030CA8BE0